MLIGGCLKPLSGRGDPATGSANDALVACLVHHWAVPVTEPTAHIVSEQGAELGRPSTLYVEVDLSGWEGQLAPGLKYTRTPELRLDIG